MGRLGETLENDAFLLAWHGASIVFGMNTRTMIQECAAYGDIPTTAVGILCMDDDDWRVQLLTLTGCRVWGRLTETLATFSSRADAETYIARTIGPSFARVCHDGASAHDGYWLG
jgi:hypothetical protein